MTDYPQALAETDHIEPVPRRIRAVLAGTTVVDTSHALYVWEWPYYPQFYIPVGDVDPAALIDEGRTQQLRRGAAALHGVQIGDVHRPSSARVYAGDKLPELAGMVRFEWGAFDSWYEEDEEVFVHPRNPYTRVDALRSTRDVRIELNGDVLGQSTAPVMVFETGLPTRYYLNRTELNFQFLVASDTVTACPYKGVTSQYWSVRSNHTLVPDLAWCYDFPTRQLLPIAGMVAFYNEKVDIFLDGQPLPRPQTKFS